MSSSAEEIQRDYYTKTASQYDDMHVSNKDHEHYAALTFIDFFCEKLRLHTLLDVGAGTGRGIRFLMERGRDVRGVEPVKALIDQAEGHGVPKGLIVEGTGYSLPFPDNAFDVVFECAVLHHVAQPERVVREMIRVSSKAIFLSDWNRFGSGRPTVRLLKLLLYKTHLWNAARFLQTRGKMYAITDGDGLAYSYSVFDSYAQLAEWADSIWLIPTSEDPRLVKTWLNPLITAPSVLLCALKTKLAE
jgi:ubiquinone/menaquinone biosynthesis C-methylase UbiE